MRTTGDPGLVRISSNVDGSEVYLGGKFVGNAPVILKLQAGDYVVEVSKQEYKKYVRELRLLAGADVTFRAELAK